MQTGEQWWRVYDSEDLETVWNAEEEEDGSDDTEEDDSTTIISLW